MNEIQKKERIALLDVTRGIAILGILLMNIRLFSEPDTAYFNPLVSSDYTGLNKLWWDFQTVFADQKFMAIFSMLFGASTAIICDGLVRKGAPVVETYTKRILLLLLIGCIHGYLLWSGDILVSYALSSWVPFLFRNARWQVSAIAGVSLLIAGTIWSLLGHYSMMELPSHILSSISEEMWSPTPEALQTQVATFQGSYIEQLYYRIPATYGFQTDVYMNWGFWRVSGVMLIGLALYRLGFLRGIFDKLTYGIVAATFIPAGLTLAYIGLETNAASGWSFPYSFFAGTKWNYWGSVFAGIGYIALIGFMIASSYFTRSFKLATNVGKAALSNYLLQTILCTTIFYGYGLGLYGKLERIETTIVVISVWAIQIALSHWWFSNYKKGPLEALWHKLTYARWSL